MSGSIDKNNKLPAKYHLTTTTITTTKRTTDEERTTEQLPVNLSTPPLTTYAHDTLKSAPKTSIRKLVP